MAPRPGFNGAKPSNLPAPAQSPCSCGVCGSVGFSRVNTKTTAGQECSASCAQSEREFQNGTAPAGRKKPGLTLVESGNGVVNVAAAQDMTLGLNWFLNPNAGFAQLRQLRNNAAAVTSRHCRALNGSRHRRRHHQFIRPDGFQFNGSKRSIGRIFSPSTRSIGRPTASSRSC